MHTHFDADANIDWATVFADQASQTGNGNGFRGFAFQRGAGVGGLISKLISFVLPLAQKVGRSLGAEALLASSRIADDLSEGKPLNESIRNRGKESYKTLVERASRKLQEGNGRKRSSNQKAVRSSRAKACKRKKAATKSTAKKRTLKDIFESWQES